MAVGTEVIGHFISVISFQTTGTHAIILGQGLVPLPQGNTYTDTQRHDTDGRKVRHSTQAACLRPPGKFLYGHVCQFSFPRSVTPHPKFPVNLISITQCKHLDIQKSIKQPAGCWGAMGRIRQTTSDHSRTVCGTSC